METAIVKFARRVRECPDDRIAMTRLMEAVRAENQTAAWATLAEWWMSVLGGQLDARELLASLYCRAAEQAPPEVACQLARAALEQSPLSSDALALLETHLPADRQRELCDHYQRFLRAAPFQRASPAIRVRLIDRLLEAGRYDEAAEEVRMLPPRSAMQFGRAEVERACHVPVDATPALPLPVLKPKAKIPVGDRTLVLEEDDIEVMWADQDDESDERRGRHSDIRALTPIVPFDTRAVRPSAKR